MQTTMTTVGDLTTRRQLLPASTPSSFVDATFRAEHRAVSVVVAHETEGAVLVSRSSFYEAMAGPLGYGWALNQERSISSLIERGMPVDRVHAAWNDPLIEVGLSLLADGLPNDTEDLLVDLTAGTYGTVSVAEVLRWVGGAYIDQSIELENRERRFRALVQSGSDAIVVVGPDHVLDYASPAYLALTGLDGDDALGVDPMELIHPPDRDDVGRARDAALAAPGTSHTVRARLCRSDGALRSCEIRVRSMMSDPAVSGLVVNIRDVTEERRLEEDLRRQALHDPLTGLPNRVLFSRWLERHAATGPSALRGLGVIYFDLDGFKGVNDSFGHATGDRVLVEAGRRLTQVSEQVKMLARLSGDEFAAIVGPASHDADRVAIALRDSLHEPVVVEGRKHHVRASFGVVVGTGDEVSTSELLRRADVAMYAAKQSGRDAVHVWNPQTDERFASRLSMAPDLAAAIESDGIHLVYQPYFSLVTGALVGIEALCRWQHPVRGMVTPPEFIALAERSGLVASLGRWVLATATRQAAQWRRQGVIGPEVTMSVNVAPGELLDVGFEPGTAEALAASGLPPTALQLEVTESAIIADTDVAANVLGRLRDAGIRIAVDDFGTGYASMDYLRLLPVDVIKIDQSFVAGLADHARDELIVNGIVRLAEALEVEVVAEGVEQQLQAELLHAMGCDSAQGYFFARPVMPEVFAATVTAAAGPWPWTTHGARAAAGTINPQISTVA
ncbi:MAG: EAL domain-containing protein [Actinomycetota bacterium]